MTPTELHDYLLNLKNKNSQNSNIDEYKKTIRKELIPYRSDQPNPPYPSDGKDVVFYSFLHPVNKPAIA